jgi:hypothetical protein
MPALIDFPSSIMKRFLPGFAFILLFAFAAPRETLAQGGSNQIPDPLRFYNKYETVWDVVRKTLLDMQFEIAVEDRSAGVLRTRSLDFSSGGLTSSDLVKFCNPPTLTDSTWVKARYTVEAILERPSSKEVLFSAQVTVEGAKRDFGGAESWVTCPSIGILERRIYSKVGSRLLGNDFVLPDKKGFWEQKPKPVPEPKKIGPSQL